jgi:hypothetical protein
MVDVQRAAADNTLNLKKSFPVQKNMISDVLFWLGGCTMFPCCAKMMGVLHS